MRGRKLIKGLSAAAFALALALMPASVAKAEEAPRTYTVERGDNLCKIAKKVYGSERMWRVIYDANSGIVKNNYIIYMGQVLIIPSVGGNSNTPAVQNTTPAATVAPEAPAIPTTPATPQTPDTPTTPVTPEAPATPEAQEYTLDYNSIVSWVDGGFIGNDASGAPVVMAIDAANEYAIIIFGDNSDMTAVSFAGPITYSGDYATITDEANGMALTFAVKQINESTITLDMGDIGSATITAAAKEDVLSTIRTAIENYRHIA